jgi:ABC-2 type transport system permease protein
MMSLQPLTLLLFIRFLLGPSEESVVLYLITGNIVLSLSLSSMLSLGQDLGWLKDDHAFEYYATLPVPKSALILAIVTRSALLALPSIVIILLLSAWFFDISLKPHPLVLFVLFLGGYSLSGLGAIIGFYSPSGRIASLLTQIIQPIIVFLSPVFVPVDRLPGALQFTANLMPTTFIARALRDSLTGNVSISTWSNMLVIAAITMGSFVLVEKGLDWRGS